MAFFDADNLVQCEVWWGYTDSVELEKLLSPISSH